MSWTENVRHLTEVFALASAGVFFIYKVLSGYLIVNMSVEVSSKRISKNEKEDFVIAKANFNKGDIGSIDIHDAKIILLSGKERMQSDIDEIIRYSFKEDSNVPGYKKINFKLQSTKTPFLRLSTNENITVEKKFAVPKDAECEIHLVVLGSRLRLKWLNRFKKLQNKLRRFGQWHSSCVSLPTSSAK